MKSLPTACLALAMVFSGMVHAAGADADTQARQIVSKLTLDEKVEQLLNGAPAVPRLNIPAYNWWTESLHGAFGPGATTNFPQPVGLAASFNDKLMQDVAASISTEVQAVYALGRHKPNPNRIGGALNTWSPNINIFRDPRWGRGQETYGEDPFLTAELGKAYVRGMQGPDAARPLVIASPKHFAVHSGPESTRHSVDVWVSAQDLEDTYLPAFRAAMVDAQAGSIMCAYNRVNGEPACASQSLLVKTLREDWKFKGYVVSDCDAVVDISVNHKYAVDAAAGAAAALKAGVDNECNGATLAHKPGLGEPYKEALKRGYIRQADIDTALVRLFSARIRAGDLPGLAERQFPAGSAINSPAHRALALRSAVESIVLLKNDGALPLKGSARIAVVGPLADARRVMRGNYSSGNTGPTLTVFEGLREQFTPAQVELVPFSPSITDGDPVPQQVFVTPDGSAGLKASYFKLQAGSPNDIGKRRFEAQPVGSHAVAQIESRPQEFTEVGTTVRTVWTGAFIAPETGSYRLGVAGMKGHVRIAGRDVVLARQPTRWAEPVALTQVDLKKGERYALQFEAESGVGAPPGMVWKRVSRQPVAELRAAAAKADVVVAVVGLTSDLEGEEMPVKIDGFSGGDRTKLDLPADQRAYLQEVAKSAKPVVVVNLSGSAIDLSWAHANAAAVIQAWYPGEGGGQAIAQVLAGAANPAGRLPVTFYKSADDLPPFDDYRMAGRTYRFFDKPVVYPFGHGLSYSTFRYEPVKVEVLDDGKAAPSVVVRTAITNTSARDGDEVAQLYLTPPRFEGAPKLALRGFQRLHLKAGERREVSWRLDARDLSFVDRDGVRQVMPGSYRVSVGGGQPDTGAPAESTTFSLARPLTLPR
ncbi:glycoside hydrolase family 3 C-terminal domain-containing protein [Pelomonas sp. Root1444]|uniref:glycoside hydrolase family 3 C-terminal domain-containing protein n=1 Tax=Pelomonas sp. Root1444 TaxID=1736464 RepID=UPI000ACEF062|nr:glycoside hydrolase family 3 C-terminal domain-containing protein [Pelomonas sp. Root1444]